MNKLLSVTFSFLFLSLYLISGTVSVSTITWLLGYSSVWIPLIALLLAMLILWPIVEISNKEDAMKTN